MPIEVENDEEKKATKSVQDLQAQLNEMRTVLTMMDRQIRAPRICAKIGSISEDLYGYNCAPQPKDDLLKLPPELQREVWSYLVSPADRLMLALSCKVHAAIFEELKGATQKSGSSKNPRKVVTDSEPTTAKKSAARKAPTKIEKLYVLYRLQKWMPKHYKLCYKCFRFRSKTRGKRKVFLNPGSKDMWSGRRVEILEEDGEAEINKKLKDGMSSGPRCPDCCERAHLLTVAAKKEHQELKRELAKLV